LTHLDYNQTINYLLTSHDGIPNQPVFLRCVPDIPVPIRFDVVQ
jgi:hypothetical protein